MVTNGVLNLRRQFNFYEPTLQELVAELQRDDEAKRLYPLCLSLDQRRRFFDYLPIVSVQKNVTTDPLFRATMVDCRGLKFVVEGDADCEVFTRNKGFVNIQKLKKTCLCMNSQAYVCKVISVEEFMPTSPIVYDIAVKYNKNFFVDGILMR